MAEEIQVLVIDVGSSSIKAGFAGARGPIIEIPSVVENKSVSLNKTKGILRKKSLKYPIVRGIVIDWEAMIILLQNTFEQLNVKSDEYPILLTESAFNPEVKREEMIKIMFEYFNVPCVYIAKQPVLDLYALGQDTGIVVNSGYSVTNIVPVNKGQIVSSIAKNENDEIISLSMNSVDIGGRDITNFLKKCLSEDGYNIDDTTDEVNNIKEKCCKVAFDFTEEFTKDDPPQLYKLLNDEVITVGSESFKCPEVLFRPIIMDLESVGIHQAVINSINSCDNLIRSDLYSNIVLSGGNTLLNGFQERMQKELDSLFDSQLDSIIDSQLDSQFDLQKVMPMVKAKVKDKVKTKARADIKINVNASINRKYSTWIGGSKLVQSGYLNDKWISRAEYEESGPQIVHSKCL